MEARYYKKLKSNKVQCNLCPHNCKIADGRTGICQVRKNTGGTLIATTYGKCSAIAVDPIEKKPLYHFHPQSPILSLGTLGCNLRCIFCQNWNISQNIDSPAQFVKPEEAVKIAKDKKSEGIAYTYSEPIIWYEFVIDTAKLAKENGLYNVLVTNGFIEKKPLAELAPYIDAMNIDVKSFKSEFYQKFCSGRLDSVIQTVEYLYDKIHIELTMLIIPTLNDDKSDIKRFVNWVSGLNDKIPVHFSRYFPQFKLSIPSTPLDTLKMAYNIAKEKLSYVYVGNAVIKDCDSTYCFNCGNPLIERQGYFVTISGLEGNRCNKCGEKQNIVV